MIACGDQDGIYIYVGEMVDKYMADRVADLLNKHGEAEQCDGGEQDGR